MPTMPLVDLRAKDSAELQTILQDERQRMFKLRFQAAGGHTAVKPHELRVARRNVARVLTILRQRKTAA